MSEQSIDRSVWIAPGAQIYGKVAIGKDASVWPNVVMRAECHSIEIGPMTNIQDFVMIHVSYDAPTKIGSFCSVTHHAVVHGCTIEDDCLIGINATIMDHAVVGRGSIVAGGAFITEHSVFPPHSIIGGVPAKIIGQRDSSRANRLNAWYYFRNAQAYRGGDHRVWSTPEFQRWLEAKREEVDADRDVDR